jgi:hypothetical protein
MMARRKLHIEMQNFVGPGGETNIMIVQLSIVSGIPMLAGTKSSQDGEQEEYNA